MIITLTRKGLFDFATFGTLQVGSVELKTVERPWRDNMPYLSCIPAGEYLVEPYSAPKFGKCFILSGRTVSRFESPDHRRFGILIHPANLAEELSGCIAVGDAFGCIMSKWGVMNSRKTVQLLTDTITSPTPLHIRYDRVPLQAQNS